MRVLHLSSEKTWRGGEQQIAYLIAEHRMKGVECFVACRKGSAFEEHCIEKDIPYRAFSFNGSSDVRTVIGIKKMAAEMNIDIIHIHSSNAHTMGVTACMLGCRSHLVLSRRVDFPPKKNFIGRFKYNYKSIRKIICVSDAIRAMVMEVVKDESKVITIHSGTDTKRFEAAVASDILRKKYNVPPHTKLIGNIAALAPHKDIFTFIATAEELIRRSIDARFFLIGEGPLRGEIEAVIREKNLGEKIHLTGFMSDVPAVMKELDLFLFTSKTEGLGTIVLEAFAAGLPVVATRAGGIPEMITDGQTGLLAPVGDAVALASSVERMLTNDSLRMAIVTRAKERVIDFSKETMAEKNLEIYSEVMKVTTR